MDQSVHYRKPGMLTRKLLNPFIALMMPRRRECLGEPDPRGPRAYERDTRRTPVNLLELDGRRYLVSARGEGQWVRNVRANAGRLTLLLGRHREEVSADEVSDDEKSQVLRAYLRKWKMEVGVFFDGVNADSEETDFRRIASNHPVFVLTDARS